MAITITDNQTPIDDADQTTGWGGGSASTYAGFQREGANCLGDQVGNGYGDQYHTITSEDYSNRTIFGWCRSGNPHSEASDGFGIILGSNTAVNQYAYTVGGSDNWGCFVSGWGGFRLDTASLPSGLRVLAGSAPTLTAITEVGYSMGYNSKANGNADNTFWDQLKYIANGSPALSFSGGTSGTPSVFSDITTADIATTAGAAYGVLRELVGAKAYEIFYGCEWGHATGSTYFNDSDFQLFVNGGGSGDAGMTAGNMDMSLLTGTGTNLFVWDNFVVVGVGTVANWDFSPLFETLELTNGSFTDAGTIDFPVTGGTSRKAEFVTFINCGQVNPNTMTFTDNNFIGTTDANGALLLDTNTIDILRLSYTSDGTGHAVYVTAAGDYNVTDSDFAGFSTASPGSNPTESTGSADAVFFNDSGGAVTLNISGGSGSITVRNGAGASTIVNNNISVTFDKMLDNTEVRIYQTSDGSVIDGIENATAGTTNNRSFSFSASAALDVYYKIFKLGYEEIHVKGYLVPGTNTTVDIQQRVDRNEYNPP